MVLPETSPASMYIIQGCIQQACEKKGWNWQARTSTVYGHSARVHMLDNFLDVHFGGADSAAEALLEAYIAAVKEEKHEL